MIEIIIKKSIYKFKDEYLFREIQDIIDSYPSTIPSSDDWWLTKSDFGIYLLTNLCINKNKIDDNIEWNEFRRIFLIHFMTEEDRNIINKNCKYLKGERANPYKKDRYFKQFLILKNIGIIFFNILNILSYKEVTIYTEYIMKMEYDGQES